MARLLCLRPCVLLLVLACICTGFSTVQGSNSTATLHYSGSCKHKDYDGDEYSQDKGYDDEYSGNGDDDAYGGSRNDGESDDGYGRGGNDYPYSSKLQVSAGSSRHGSVCSIILVSPCAQAHCPCCCLG